MNKTIVVVGPTAVGKTKISIMLAKRYNLSVISGDSVAVYKTLDIGSAKPTLSERDGIVHHLIDIRDAGDTYSTFDFQREARAIMDKNPLSLICGGTGLYIQSALFDYEFKASKRDLDFGKKYEHLSNEELYNLLLSKDDKIDKQKLHPNNRKRVLRALEVFESLNQSIHSFDNKKEALYDYFIVYLSLDRQLLYDRINKRVDKMISDGLIAEAKALYDEKKLVHAIGYSELFLYFDGKITKQEAIELIKKNSRHLAKRQETWFKNQMTSHFYNVDLENIDNTFNQIVFDIDRWLK